MSSNALISEEYRRQNADLHESNKFYGVSGSRWAKKIDRLATNMKAETILDYGCGKQTLARSLPHLNIKGYDPAFEELSAPAEPADFVVCTDVLEHIEPDLLDNVLDDLQRVTKGHGFFNVATYPAAKTLSDGRNAHLIQEQLGWWFPKIESRFMVAKLQNYGEHGGFWVIVKNFQYAKDEYERLKKAHQEKKRKEKQEQGQK